MKNILYDFIINFTLENNNNKYEGIFVRLNCNYNQALKDFENFIFSNVEFEDTKIDNTLDNNLFIFLKNINNKNNYFKYHNKDIYCDNYEFLGSIQITSFKIDRDEDIKMNIQSETIFKISEENENNIRRSDWSRYSSFEIS